MGNLSCQVSNGIGNISKSITSYKVDDKASSISRGNGFKIGDIVWIKSLNREGRVSLIEVTMLSSTDKGKAIIFIEYDRKYRHDGDWFSDDDLEFLRYEPNSYKFNMVRYFL